MLNVDEQGHFDGHHVVIDYGWCPAEVANGRHHAGIDKMGESLGNAEIAVRLPVSVEIPT